RSILLHMEQGIGDMIQFIRYLPLVAARGGNVIVECVREMKQLFAPLRTIGTWIDHGDPLPPFDVHCPMASLPLAFHTTIETIPAAVPYLRADPTRVAHWRARGAGPSSGRHLNIGLAWAGRPTHENDPHRSIPLQLLAPLFQLPGATFYSLQKGEAAAQAKN